MTRQELKHAIRNGDRVPDVPQDLYEAMYAEVLREDHPDSRLVTLQESRSSSDLPAGIHERVAAMLDASRVRRDQVRKLTESRSDLKDPALVDPPSDDDSVAKILAAAGARYKQATDPDTVTARALNHDRIIHARPKAFHDVTLAEAIAEARSLPEGIHAIVASRLANGGR